MLNQVKELIASQLRIDINTIEDDSNIIDDLGADSLDIVDMIMLFEEEFNFSIPDEDIQSLRTVRAVAEYIEKNK